MIFYFSGCGNSRWIAEEIAEALGEELRFIPDLQREGFSSYNIKEEESIGFIFPIYSWAAPKLVEDLVLQTEWKGKAKYVWFACTCGDEMGKTRQMFRKTLAKAGLQLDACFCFQMPETYLDFPGFHLDTEEGAQRKIDNAKAKLPTVIGQIRNREAVFDEIVGSFPLFKSYVCRPAFLGGVTDRKYFSTEDCIGCGICVKVCPLKNVTLNADKRPQWNGNCTQCMACYQYCPKNAIHFGSCTQGKGQYHFKGNPER